MDLKEKQRQIRKSCRDNEKMNTANNARRRKSQNDIRKAYLNLVISRNDIASITVSDICKKAGVNRTTFYAQYDSIEDLNSSIFAWMVQEFLSVFSKEAEYGEHSFDFLKLFRNIKENQIFYKLYFKLGFDFKDLFLKNGAADIASQFMADTSHIDYHIEFFAAGITAIIQKWLNCDCKESPETIARILVDEYQKKNTYRTQKTS